MSANQEVNMINFKQKMIQLIQKGVRVESLSKKNEKEKEKELANIDNNRITINDLTGWIARAAYCRLEYIKDTIIQYRWPEDSKSAEQIKSTLLCCTALRERKLDFDRQDRINKTNQLYQNMSSVSSQKQNVALVIIMFLLSQAYFLAVYPGPYQKLKRIEIISGDQFQTISQQKDDAGKDEVKQGNIRREKDTSKKSCTVCECQKKIQAYHCQKFEKQLDEQLLIGSCAVIVGGLIALAYLLCSYYPNKKRIIINDIEQLRAQQRTSDSDDEPIQVPGAPGNQEQQTQLALVKPNN